MCYALGEPAYCCRHAARVAAVALLFGARMGRCGSGEPKQDRFFLRVHPPLRAGGGGRGVGLG